ncbi:large subunit ribosomal protein L25 [Alkalithermobacter thermoalcaliphilus JW-YL-7 = DSM 7308]|uniref:Large ribosomal subunit protein bL25 n=1 Tax=Alkalithermobacter thermoalcaliphilus JW-YL-7 = DSM 7308 TaxID=1121328 RepID=A0A150FMX9_CLOPD|nr:50S ribosomal protein L25 [[Clostridium] paradoxum JW-YL-7 = DSM 7308]SHL36716.1 large subunit ribosomal protein L25 [[Clostridium] paradoxum JW-YL-7 = DSM 7308]
MNLTLRSFYNNMNNKKLRKQGLIPGVLYGKDLDPICVVADKKELQEFYKNNRESNVADITLENKRYTVHIQDIQKHGVDNQIIHFDLHKVNKHDTISTHIPVVLVNKEELERQGLVVQQQVRDIEVKYQAHNNPKEIDVDISRLSHGEYITIGDLPSPQGVEILEDYNTIVASVNYPKTYIETPDE